MKKSNINYLIYKVFRLREYFYLTNPLRKRLEELYGNTDWFRERGS